MTDRQPELTQQPLMMEIGGRHVTLNVLIMSQPKPTRAIFLCHDLAGRADDFAPLAPHLAAAGFRVVMWDMPGRGQSAWLDPQAYTVRNYATVFLSLMKEHALDQNALLGQGWGAMLALLFESLLKTSVNHLSLIDLPETWSYGTDRHAQLWAKINTLATKDREAFMKVVSTSVPEDLPTRDAICAVATARARLRNGLMCLGMDQAIFENLKSTEETSYSPGAGLTQCHASVSLLQSEGYPFLSGPKVKAVRLPRQQSLSWEEPALLWTALGAVTAGK